MKTIKFSPIPQISQTQIDSFWKKVDVRGDDECWNWMKSLDSWGYGHVGFWDKIYKTNRVAWTIKNGKIPDGMIIRHSCDNPKCCNPNHLLIGTSKQNSIDCVERGRMSDRRGERNNAAKLTLELAAQIKSQYQRGVFGYSRLAKKFGFSRACIQRLCRGIAWTEL